MIRLGRHQEADSETGDEPGGQEPNSEIAEDIRHRLEELGTPRAEKQRALEAAEKELAQVPDPPESAEALVAALPLLDVDWELVSADRLRAVLGISELVGPVVAPVTSAVSKPSSGSTGPIVG